uniref:Uncharacterized protein n=1 Tax=Arundo donax TaxID=35708 RepID=A0A0A9AA27_ARUDO
MILLLMSIISDFFKNILIS